MIKNGYSKNKNTDYQIFIYFYCFFTQVYIIKLYAMRIFGC